jgi:hypothetical protein
MSEVTISRHRLRELEICAELASNLLKAFADAKEPSQMITAILSVLAQYEARMAVSDAMVSK